LKLYAEWLTRSKQLVHYTNFCLCVAEWDNFIAKENLQEIMETVQ
jgi:hypothetical protein